jgi:hypothetical protein
VVRGLGLKFVSAGDQAAIALQLATLPAVELQFFERLHVGNSTFTTHAADKILNARNLKKTASAGTSGCTAVMHEPDKAPTAVKVVALASAFVWRADGSLCLLPIVVVDCFKTAGRCCFQQYISAETSPSSRQVVPLTPDVRLWQASFQLMLAPTATAAHEFRGKRVDIDETAVVACDLLVLHEQSSDEEYLEEPQRQHRRLMRMALPRDVFLATAKDANAAWR